jgi:serine/tyrosine/threonine adenylyltransferase
MLTFTNRFARELPGDPNPNNFTRQVTGALWSSVMPASVAAPRLLAHSPEVATMLGLSEVDMQSPAVLAALSGTGTLPGMQPIATCYGGHQFGNWAGQLGDGRAILLGETLNAQGAHFELQLKGAGPTPYSRTADGRAVLRSSVREFLCSEAMHHLGVPTTRALSLVSTGDAVTRDMFYDGNARPEPGAVVCRVAPTFIRFGHFELPASRGDFDLLRKLVHFTIGHYAPEHFASGTPQIAAWFQDICARTAVMVAHWMRVGFVHGVMNTDNMSILGLTIDYGPYGWVDNFDPNWTPNTTDAQGRRYCFGRQPAIARWNLACLAEALAAIEPDHDALGAALEAFDDTYNATITQVFQSKFGFDSWRENDGALVSDAFKLLEDAEVDMTEFFRRLATLTLAETPTLQSAYLRPACYQDAVYTQHEPALQSWLARYAARTQTNTTLPSQRLTTMNATNPRYVLRNYLAQQAIDLAEQGDASMVNTLLDVLRNPYVEQTGREALAAKRPDWARHKAGCSMLSCSS